MIERIIKQRMDLIGKTNAEVANAIGCSSTQLGIFLNGKGFLNQKALEKCLELTGINLNLYQHRFDVACEVAQKLINLNVDVSQVVEMSQQEMTSESGVQEVMSFLDVSNGEKFDEIYNNEIVDVESTFPYFKIIVLQLMQSGLKTTPKKAEKALDDLAKIFSNVNFVLMGVSTISFLVGNLFLKNSTYNRNATSFMSSIFTLAKSLFNNKK